MGKLIFISNGYDVIIYLINFYFGQNWLKFGVNNNIDMVQKTIAVRWENKQSKKTVLWFRMGETLVMSAI